MDNIKKFRNKKTTTPQYPLSNPSIRDIRSMREVKRPKRHPLCTEIEAFLEMNKELYQSRIDVLQTSLLDLMDEVLVIPELSHISYWVNYESIYDFLCESVEAELLGEELGQSYPILIGEGKDGFTYSIHVLEQKINNNTIAAFHVVKSKKEQIFDLNLQTHKWGCRTGWFTDEVASLAEAHVSAVDLIRLTLSKLSPEMLKFVTPEHVKNTLISYKDLILLVDHYEGMLDYAIYKDQVIAVPSEMNDGFAIRQNGDKTYDICLYLDPLDFEDDASCIFYPTIKGLYFDEVHAYIREYIDRYAGLGLYTFPLSSSCVIQAKFTDIEDEKDFNKLMKGIDSPYVKEIRDFLFEG